MKSMMKKALSIVIAIAVLLVPVTAFAATGDAADPYQVVAGGTSTVAQLPAEGYAWFQATGNYGSADVTVECTSTEYSVMYCRQDVGANFTLTNGNDMFFIQNLGDTAITVTVTVSEGVSTGGTFDNPKQLTFDSYNYASDLVDFAGVEDFYWQITAVEDGTIGVIVDAFDSNWEVMEWGFSVSNKTTNISSYFIWSDSEGQGYEEVIDVSAGDVIEIAAGAYDSSWTPAPAYLSVTINNYGNGGSVGAGTFDSPATATLGTQTASATASGYYYYTYTALEEGTATVTMNNASGWQYFTAVNVGLSSESYNPSHRYDNDPVVASEDIEMYANDVLTIAVSAIDSNSEYVNADVNWTLDFVAGTIGGGAGGVEVYEELADQFVIGDNAPTLSTNATYTVYTFTPSQTGTYTFTAGQGTTMGIVSYIDLWVQTDPADFASVVVEDTIVWDCEAVGQSIKIAVISDSAVADINLERSDLNVQSFQWTEYENTVAPTDFTMDGDKEELMYVDFEDDVIDQAVLGADGYYHLNAANGPILYANLNDSMLSLFDAYCYGRLKATVSATEGVNYNAAFKEYYDCSDEGYYPLTDDLIQMFKHIGTSQGWYVTDGWIGDAEDAWLFACYYFEGEINDGGLDDGDNGNQGDGGAGEGNGNQGDDVLNPIIPDTDSSSFAWAVAMMLAFAAAYVSIVVRKVRRVK